MKRATKFFIGLLVQILAAATIVAYGAAKEQPSVSITNPSLQKSEEKKIDWPTKNIELVCPMVPGGGYDIVSRITAPFIEKYLPKKVKVVVNNRTGAGGKIGMMHVAKSKPDGYTIGLLNPLDFAIIQVRNEVEGLDLRKFSWIARLDAMELMFLVGTHTGIQSVKDVVGKNLRLGAPGVAVSLQALSVGKAMGAIPRIVGYDGMAEAHIAAMRGDVDGVVVPWGVGAPRIEGSQGKLKGIFVCSEQRIPRIKDIPTYKEVGVRFDENTLSLLYLNHALSAPPGLGPHILKIYEDALTHVTKDPEWQEKMNKATIPPAIILGRDRVNAKFGKILQGVEQNKDILAEMK